MTSYYELELLARSIVADRTREAKNQQRWNLARKAAERLKKSR